MYTLHRILSHIYTIFFVNRFKKIKINQIMKKKCQQTKEYSLDTVIIHCLLIARIFSFSFFFLSFGFVVLTQGCRIQLLNRFFCSFKNVTTDKPTKLTTNKYLVKIRIRLHPMNANIFIH